MKLPSSVLSLILISLLSVTKTQAQTLKPQAVSVTTGSPTLLELQQATIFQNPELKARYASSETAKNNIEIANVARYPSISANIGKTYGRGEDKFPNTNVASSKVNETGKIGFNITQNLYDPTIKLNIEQAKLSYKASEYASSQTYDDLTNRTVSLFLDILANQAQIELLDGQQTAVAAQKKQAQKSFEVGTVSITDVREAEAKADKIARMFAVVGNTAMGITAALATVPPNPVLAAIVGAIGAIQLGVIAAQPLPEKQSYATGGFTGSGFGSADSTGLKPAGIVHQNEWVAPPWMLQQPRTAKVIDYLESIRQGKTTPMAEGGYSDSNFVNKSQDISTNADTSNADYVQFISALMQVKDLLQKLYDEGITAEMTDSEQNGKLFKKAIKKFETIENRASGK